jgi:hypothetical protein
MDALKFTIEVNEPTLHWRAVAEATIIIVELELPPLSVTFPDSYKTRELNYYEQMQF